jgi:hypothetical protein
LHVKSRIEGRRIVVCHTGLKDIIDIYREISWNELFEIILSSVMGLDLYVASDLDWIALAWAGNSGGVLVCFQNLSHRKRLSYLQRIT